MKISTKQWAIFRMSISILMILFGTLMLVARLVNSEVFTEQQSKYFFYYLVMTICIMGGVGTAVVNWKIIRK